MQLKFEDRSYLDAMSDKQKAKALKRIYFT